MPLPLRLFFSGSRRSRFVPPPHRTDRDTLARIIPLHCFPLSTDRRLRLPPPRHRRAVSPGFQLVCWTTLSPRGLLATDPVLVFARPLDSANPTQFVSLVFSESLFRVLSALLSTRPWWKYVVAAAAAAAARSLIAAGKKRRSRQRRGRLRNRTTVSRFVRSRLPSPKESSRCSFRRRRRRSRCVSVDENARLTYIRLSCISVRRKYRNGIGRRCGVVT